VAPVAPVVKDVVDLEVPVEAQVDVVVRVEELVVPAR
jgi:hypothetical protein